MNFTAKDFHKDKNLQSYLKLNDILRGTYQGQGMAYVFEETHIVEIEFLAKRNGINYYNQPGRNYKIKIVDHWKENLINQEIWVCPAQILSIMKVGYI